MYKAEDVQAGRGITRKKPHTRVLPYLRAEQAEKTGKAVPIVKDRVTKSTQDREAQKTVLKHIHPSATEAELEEMVDL